MIHEGMAFLHVLLVRIVLKQVAVQTKDYVTGLSSRGTCKGSSSLKATTRAYSTCIAEPASLSPLRSTDEMPSSAKARTYSSWSPTLSGNNDWNI